MEATQRLKTQLKRVSDKNGKGATALPCPSLLFLRREETTATLSFNSNAQMNWTEICHNVQHLLTTSFWETLKSVEGYSVLRKSSTNLGKKRDPGVDEDARRKF